jgi:hypothetical protein
MDMTPNAYPAYVDRAPTWWPVSAAAAGLVLSTPFATWWLIGDQSVRGVPDLDYLFRLDVDPLAERLIGIGSLVMLAVSVLILLLTAGRRGVDRRWGWVVGPLVVAGIIVGSGLRVLTAGVIGANIGGAAILLVGPPVVAVLVLSVLGVSLYLLTAGSRRSGSTWT